MTQQEELVWAAVFALEFCKREGFVHVDTGRFEIVEKADSAVRLLRRIKQKHNNLHLDPSLENRGK